MPAAASGPSGGRHLLGPHVVGQRVVIRHLVPGESGPSGGPALTDVLGICESWADGLVTLRRHDDSVVAVPVRDIVSGKPVPPRASVRHRVSAQDAERHGLWLWSQVSHDEVGAWVLRLQTDPSPRLFKRANSALAMTDPGLPLPEAAARTVEFYRRHDRTPLAQVVADSDVEHGLRELGWRPLPDGETVFQIASMAMLRRSMPAGDDIRLTEHGPRVEAELTADDGTVPARGRAVLDDDWLGLHSLHTVAEQRRRGLGTRVLAALLDWGAERGARSVWLHVETDNPVAQAWYDALDFRTHHHARYLTPG